MTGSRLLLGGQTPSVVGPLLARVESVHQGFVPLPSLALVFGPRRTVCPKVRIPSIQLIEEDFPVILSECLFDQVGLGPSGALHQIVKQPSRVFANRYGNGRHKETPSMLSGVGQLTTRPGSVVNL